MLPELTEFLCIVNWMVLHHSKEGIIELGSNAPHGTSTWSQVEPMGQLTPKLGYRNTSLGPISVGLCLGISSHSHVYKVNFVFLGGPHAYESPPLEAILGYPDF